MRKYTVEKDAVETANATVRECMAEVKKALREDTREDFNFAFARYKEASAALMTLVRMSL